MTLEMPLTDDQLPKLAQLLAESPQFAQLVASNLRDRKDSYKVSEAAEKLGVCEHTIRNRIKAKVIPTVMGSSPARIPAAYIDKQLNPHA